MPQCIRIKRRHRKQCVGDLKDELFIRDRAIVPPVAGDPDFDESFTANVTIWAGINTVTGKTFFDGVNGDVNITHVIYIRWDSTVNAESWVELLDGTRLRILAIENLEERNEFLKLTCTERGLNTVAAAKA